MVLNCSHPTNKDIYVNFRETTIIYKVYFWDAKFIISSETESSKIIFSAKKKRRVYCNLYVEDFEKFCAKPNTKSATLYF